MTFKKGLVVLPLRFQNPFADPRPPLREDVNPFLQRVLHNQAYPELPLLVGSRLAVASKDWRAYFAATHGLPQCQDRELVVEVGCYKGKTLVELALSCPDKLFVGIDITYKRVVLSAERIKKHSLKNAVSVLTHINPTSFRQLFADHEISQCLIFFPDPWSKPRQVGHRLLSETFSQALFECCRRDGGVWFKSDQRFYFEDAALQLEKAGFGITGDLVPDGLPPVLTPFENTFMSQNLETFTGVWRKKT